MELPTGTPRPCKGCGTTIFKSKFCGDQCRIEWYRATATERSRRYTGSITWAERYPQGHLTLTTRSCEHCGQEFTRRKRPKDAARYCSKACAGAARTALRIASEPQRHVRHCQRCNTLLAERRRSYCPPCAKERAKEQCREWYYQSRGDVACPDCGVPIPNDGSYAHRCGPCRAKREASVKRAGRSARKLRVRSATVERFDPFEVLERDKWRCHICGCKTPKRLRGTYEANAPELDHIVPLAAGGEHSRRNTACACRKCNIAKSDKPLGQMRLVA